MTREEAVNWIINITADIGKAEHRDLWHYEQALYEIRELLEEQPDQRWIPVAKEQILQAGYEGREVRFHIGGRLFAIRELAQ